MRLESLLTSSTFDSFFKSHLKCSSDRTSQKNSSSLNQRDEEEILFSEKAPGPPNGWKRKQTCRVSSFVLLIRCIASITVPGLFRTTEHSFGNCFKLLEVYPLIFQKSRKMLTNFGQMPESLKLYHAPNLMNGRSLGNSRSAKNIASTAACGRG